MGLRSIPPMGGMNCWKGLITGSVILYSKLTAGLYVPGLIQLKITVKKILNIKILIRLLISSATLQTKIPNMPIPGCPDRIKKPITICNITIIKTADKLIFLIVGKTGFKNFKGNLVTLMTKSEIGLLKSAATYCSKSRTIIIKMYAPIAALIIKTKGLVK